MNKKEIGIYIHIPFCVRKCYYCDFVSYTNKSELIENYVNAIKKEIKIVGKEHNEVNTIYIGGGTPSFIKSEYIVDIIKTIKQVYNVKANAEITIEANPGTLTKQKLKDYIKIGVNRISIGLQSTNNSLLKQIGRIHTYEEFLESYELVREVGFKNVNVDLMLNLPNQTIEILENSVEKLIKLNPEHVSVYSLILEENTKLYDLVENKKLQLLEEDIERQMYWLVKDKLEKGGYVQYEISNFSKKGYEAKHNINCWNQEEYVGIGISAHSYIGNIRYSNIVNIEKYIQILDINNNENEEYKKSIIIHEKQSKFDKEKEYMMLGLRKIEGVSIQKFKQKFIENPLYLFRKELDKLVKENLIEVDEDCIKLTNKGLDLANLVFYEFI